MGKLFVDNRLRRWRKEAPEAFRRCTDVVFANTGRATPCLPFAAMCALMLDAPKYMPKDRSTSRLVLAFSRFCNGTAKWHDDEESSTSHGKAKDKAPEENADSEEETAGEEEQPAKAEAKANACQRCTKSFDRASSLRQHMTKVHGAKPCGHASRKRKRTTAASIKVEEAEEAQEKGDDAEESDTEEDEEQIDPREKRPQQSGVKKPKRQEQDEPEDSVPLKYRRVLREQADFMQRWVLERGEPMQIRLRLQEQQAAARCRQEEMQVLRQKMQALEREQGACKEAEQEVAQELAAARKEAEEGQGHMKRLQECLTV